MAPSCLGGTCYRPANWGPSTDVRASITLGSSPTYNTMAVSVLKKWGGRNPGDHGGPDGAPVGRDLGRRLGIVGLAVVQHLHPLPVDQNDCSSHREEGLFDHLAGNIHVRTGDQEGINQFHCASADSDCLVAWILVVLLGRRRYRDYVAGLVV